MARNATKKGTPAVFTEQPHIFYVPGALSWDYGVKDFWGQALHDVWQGVWDADGALGCFIWEWQDQSMDDKFADKSRDIDPETGLRMVAKKGVVDGYRHIKPEYWHVKMVYSPLVVRQRTVEPRDGQANVWVDNRYSFTDLGELTVRWQALADDRELAKGVLKAAGAPRGTACLSVPVSRGAEAVRLDFVHPDGRTVYSCRLAVAGVPEPQPPAPPAARGTLAVRDAAEALEVAGDGVRAIWDKASGALRSWQVGGVERLAAPWQINLGEQRPNGGEHGSGGFVRSGKPPVLRKPAVIATARGASVTVQVSGELGLAESPEKKADWLCTTEVMSDGELRVSYELRWSAADTEAWELGLALPLAPNYRTMRWLRDALWTDYPADHIGRPAGTAKADDLAFRCTHRDLRWLVMGDGAHQVVLLPLDGPLHGRAVAGEQAVVLYASAAVAPPRDFSTNLLPGYTIGLRKGGVWRGALRVRGTG
ncbi:MAG: hypothetical protein HYU66_14145 [Armatimonadetes bacterium]|nr:hypothetical protein [Armatimonadota bacterium]